MYYWIRCLLEIDAFMNVKFHSWFFGFLFLLFSVSSFFLCFETMYSVCMHTFSVGGEINESTEFALFENICFFFFFVRFVNLSCTYRFSSIICLFRVCICRDAKFSVVSLSPFFFWYFDCCRLWHLYFGR